VLGLCMKAASRREDSLDYVAGLTRGCLMEEAKGG
jgi:hypothetical protein